jgi:hypothetical protein
MKRSFALAVVASTLLALGPSAPVTAREVQPAEEPLDVYTATVSTDVAAELSTSGVDIVNAESAGAELTIDAVLTESQVEVIEERTGVVLEPKLNEDGLSQRQQALAQAANGFTVWRSWDEDGGIEDELKAFAEENRNIVKLESLGTTHQGRELIAVKITQRARFVRDGSRPAVLYNSLQHAREWISVEVNRRLMHWYVDQWRADNREIRELLRTTELWFVIVANPDGYQRTFDVERLWRKNARDNNGDGEITFGDGVDLNRNFDEHWSYDEEGSSSLPASDTYRGPSPVSEPEIQFMQDLIVRIKPKFMANFHSTGPLILYPQGWQIGTPDADNPIYTALGGTDANPAIPTFDPGISSDELYVTNGETTDFADVNGGTIAFTPELGEGIPGSGFVFPDNEALVQAEFARTIPFSLGLARSAGRPDDPVSPTGIETEPFYLDQADIDPENGPLSMFDFTFERSYGDPQEVRVLAARRLGPVTVRFRINGGTVQSAPTTEWTGGARYGPGEARYYAVMSGVVTGTNPGDSVEVWFEGGDERSHSFTYQAVSETGNPVLIMAAEDYTGASPVYPVQTGPSYLGFYTSALDANGIAYDVYDVDANGRTAPDPLGVLGHYDAVVWYTANDIITREPGWGAGNASSLAHTEMLAIRDYINEGGKVLYTGKYAGHQYAGGHGSQFYDPYENLQCSSSPAISARCRNLRGSGNGVGDVLEYWFGAGLVNEAAGIDPTSGTPLPVLGVDGPLAGLSFGFNGADSAQNQDHNASFITTSGLLPVDRFPQFASSPAARYDRGAGGPFDPHSGTRYVYSQIADISYKRLTRTIAVPAGGANLSFWTSFDTEAEWDFVFVEARTAGGQNWTTLPDLGGHTTQDTGESCPAEWRDLHPHLDHYQTVNANGTCSPSGSSGAWHAASGNSGGWQQWSVDLSAYAGSTVEISLAYVSDWATQGLGVFLDDIVVSTGEGSTDFEAAGLNGWAASGSPPGSAPNSNDWILTDAAGFPEAAVVATASTLYMGFGFEGISDAATRNAVMGAAIDYLLS